MERIETDILIAGGGVAGLTTAAAFGTAGFSVLCVDPVPPVVDAGAAGSDRRSTAFLMPAVELLERAGLWTRLAPEAAALKVMRIADAGGEAPEIRETADFTAAEIGREAFGYNLPNWLLRREMVARLTEIDEATLRAGVGLDGFTPRSREVLARLSDGTQVAAKLLIAADGRESMVREALGIGVRRWGHGQKAIVFNVRHELPHDGVSIEIHRTGGPFTLVPMPDHDGQHQSAIVWMESGPRAAELKALSEPEFEAAVNLRACGALGRLDLASPRQIWPIIGQVAMRLDGPRTALVAESAHVIPPIGAQGLNMSLRDIATLLDLTIAARDRGEDIGSAELLGRYHRARHPDILARVAGVAALNLASAAEVPVLRDLRRAGLRLLHGAAPLRRRAMTLGLGR